MNVSLRKKTTNCIWKMFLAVLIKLSKFLPQFSFLKRDSLCNVILYRQCLFTAYGHSKLLFDLCSVIHFSFSRSSFFFFLLLLLLLLLFFFFFFGGGVIEINFGDKEGPLEKFLRKRGGHHILQELLVKSHQLPLNQTKNERSLMAMHCNGLK